MILNHEEIKEQKIIEDYNENNFSEGSYNLTISHVIDMDNKVSDGFNLKPQGMVYVVFKEKIKVPKNVIGFAHVKTSLTRQGIMATNIGIIDTNYEGYISTLLINFGKTPNYFGKNQSALRITFSYIKEPKLKIPLKNSKLENEVYINKLKENIAKLDEKFLNLSSVRNDVIQDIATKILGFGILFGIGSFALSAYFNNKTSSEKELEKEIRKYQTELSTIKAENSTLNEKFIQAEFHFKFFKDSLHKVNKNKDKK